MGSVCGLGERSAASPSISFFWLVQLSCVLPSCSLPPPLRIRRPPRHPADRRHRIGDSGALIILLSLQCAFSLSNFTYTRGLGRGCEASTTAQDTNRDRRIPTSSSSSSSPPKSSSSELSPSSEAQQQAQRARVGRGVAKCCEALVAANSAASPLCRECPMDEARGQGLGLPSSSSQLAMLP